MFLRASYFASAIWAETRALNFCCSNWLIANCCADWVANSDLDFNISIWVIANWLSDLDAKNCPIFCCSNNKEEYWEEAWPDKSDLDLSTPTATEENPADKALRVSQAVSLIAFPRMLLDWTISPCISEVEPFTAFIIEWRVSVILVSKNPCDVTVVTRFSPALRSMEASKVPLAFCEALTELAPLRSMAMAKSRALSAEAWRLAASVTVVVRRFSPATFSIAVIITPCPRSTAEPSWLPLRSTADTVCPDVRSIELLFKYVPFSMASRRPRVVWWMSFVIPAWLAVKLRSESLTAFRTSVSSLGS